MGAFHLHERVDLKLPQTRGAKHCHCPTSNLFLGSGLFDTKTHIEMYIEVGMGSDIGAGTLYKMLCVRGDMREHFISYALLFVAIAFPS